MRGKSAGYCARFNREPGAPRKRAELTRRQSAAEQLRAGARVEVWMRGDQVTLVKLNGKRVGP